MSSSRQGHCDGQHDGLALSLASLTELLQHASKDDVSYRGENGKTALHWAVHNKHVEIVQLLVGAGANLEAQGQEGLTPLQSAIHKGNVKIVQLLVGAGANLEVHDKEGWKPLYNAVTEGKMEITKLLIDAGASLEAQAKVWQTPLLYAVQIGSIEMAQLLVGAGANLEAQDKDGDTALYGAMLRGNVEMVQLLVGAGANLETMGKDTQLTPLASAVNSGTVEMVRLLVGAGANLDAQDKNGWTVLYSAVCSGNLEMVQLLLGAGANIETGDKRSGITALIRAVKKDSADMVQLLVRAGANLEARDQDTGWTPLQLAVHQGSAEILQLLVSGGANLEAHNRTNGWRPLYSAVHAGEAKLVQLLVRAGANLEAGEEALKQTPLYTAVDCGYVEIVDLLVRAGANLEAQDNLRKTALMLAREQGKIDIAQLLLDAGAKDAGGGNNVPSPSARISARELGETSGRKSDSPPTTTVEPHTTGPSSTLQALRSECKQLLQHAQQVVQRRDLVLRTEAIGERLSAAKATRDAALMTSITREKAALLLEGKSITISTEEGSALPTRLQDLENRLFDFLCELSDAPECDADTSHQVAALHRSVQEALEALAASPKPPSETTVTPPTPPSPAEHTSAAYLCGSIPIVDLKPSFDKGTADGATAPSARRMLRGRFETKDGLNRVYQCHCVIKCAAEVDASSPHPDLIAAMRREHDVYREVQRLAEQGKSGCVELYAAHPQHHYLVLEDHGADLRTLLKPSLRFPHQVLEAVVSAVHALHSLGIMHGDIKPQNLLYKLYDHGYVVKLCDLDAAYKVGETCRAASLGTAHYHAPELRAAAQGSDTIKAALELDMFALGLVMWQVLVRSSHAGLDCDGVDDLYADQDALHAHLNFRFPYKVALQKAVSIKPAQRMNIADLSRAIGSASASSGWQIEQEKYQQLKSTVGAQLGTISEQLDKMDAKLDTVLLELRSRFDALGDSVVEVGESLRREVVLGSQQAQVLPDIIQATQDTLRRLADASATAQQTPQSPSAAAADMQECMTSMQASIQTAVSRALEEQKTASAAELRALAGEMQGRFAELSSELQMHLDEQRQSGAQAAQQFQDLHHTSACLKTGLTEVLHSLSAIHGELRELKENQVQLGVCMGKVLAGNAELNSMVRDLITDTHGIPTFAIILPVVSSGWKNRFSPMRLLRDQYRLYFLCSHTHQIAPCGPKGKGYKITMNKQWVLDAAPVLRVGLLLVKLALLASGLPLPIPDLCSVLVGTAMHAQYLNAALHLVVDPPDSANSTTELVMQQTLDAIEKHDVSHLVDAQKLQREGMVQMQEGTKKAYDTIRGILSGDGVNIPLTCGLRQVTHRGKTAWVLDNDATEREWRGAVDKTVP